MTHAEPFLFFFFGCTHGMWDLSSQTRGPGIEPAPPAVEARSLNQWTAREVPTEPFLYHQENSILLPTLTGPDQFLL